MAGYGAYGGYGARPPPSYGGYGGGPWGNSGSYASGSYFGIQDSGAQRQKVQGYSYTTGAAPAYTPPLGVPGLGGYGDPYGMSGMPPSPLMMQMGDPLMAGNPYYGSSQYPMLGPTTNPGYGYSSYGGMPPPQGMRPPTTAITTSMPGAYPGNVPMYGGGMPMYGGGPPVTTTMTTSMPPMQTIPPPTMTGRTSYTGMR
mmetsp:Transcript_54414/g.129678  ORF Transcript_54414/g.129678 Transcript_54414/m.129678 type:complete len:199 (-) Transcript_54414:27-623(-)